MTNRYIEVRITNAHADQMVKENLSEEFTERFIRGDKHTDIRFGPLNLNSDEIQQVRLALDFLYGLKPKSTLITAKPF
jgi:hypothetical protein